MCLEMLEGRFLCILLGCIEIMYFLEDLVVCKFEITGQRLGTWVPRWEASIEEMQRPIGIFECGELVRSMS